MRIFTIISVLTILVSCGSERYEVLNEEVNMNVCRLQVKLQEKESVSSLEKIAKELREEREAYDKLWISFFQPNLLPDKSGNGAWAMASFTPELNVELLGENQPLTDDEPTATKYPNYVNVIDMLNASGDYTGNKAELIDSTEGSIHVRVSSEFSTDETQAAITEQVRRDIVYVTFQVFAQTDLDNITVTSIPIVRESFNPNVEYDGKLQGSQKETISISRAKATEILSEYVQTESFQDLYQLSGTLYLPNEQFERLKYGELTNVFKEMKK